MFYDIAPCGLWTDVSEELFTFRLQGRQSAEQETNVQQVGAHLKMEVIRFTETSFHIWTTDGNIYLLRCFRFSRISTSTANSAQFHVNAPNFIHCSSRQTRHSALQGTHLPREEEVTQGIMQNATL
jgi:hypothetical protein